jgi:hypothetical protein
MPGAFCGNDIAPSLFSPPDLLGSCPSIPVTSPATNAIPRSNRVRFAYVTVDLDWHFYHPPCF